MISRVRIDDQSLPMLPAYSRRPVAVVVLDPLALDFLLDYLPEDDGMTRDLRKLREAAVEELWSQAK